MSGRPITRTLRASTATRSKLQEQSAPRMLGERCSRRHQVRANIEVLTRLVSAQGEPRYLRSDNEPAFVALNSLQPVTEDL